MRPKGKRGVLNLLRWLEHIVFGFLDRIDTRVFFHGRKVPTETGRVRSRYERKLTNYFDEEGIKYIYEPGLVLEGSQFKPDFFLPDYGVYVEFWGLADSNQGYKRHMRRKMKIYAKNNVSVVSVYPRHLKNIRRQFPLLLEKQQKS